MSRNNSVEDTTEIGTEIDTRENISNPNRTNTLNYFYYEVLERIEVLTRPNRIELFLLVPLRVEPNAPTLPWLLANECILRPLMPCSTLQASFDAVKRLLVLNEIEDLKAQAQRDQQKQDQQNTQADANRAASLKNLIEATLRSYKKLSGADQSSGPGSWFYWSFIDILAPELRNVLGTLQAAWDALDSDQRQQLAQQGRILGQFFDALGSVDDAFLKVNVAVDIVEGAAIVGSLFLSVAALIWPIELALEAMGIDVLPDDDGLRNAILKLKQSYDAAFTPIPPVPAAPAGATAQQQSAAQADALRQSAIADAQFEDRAEAQVETNRLVEHVTQNLDFYYQAIWSSLPEASVRQAITDAGIDSGFVEPRFAAFRGSYGVCRITDDDRLKKGGFAIKALEQSLLEKAAKNQTAFTFRISVPTPGFMVEPNMGICAGGDSFVAGHRDLDLKARQAEVDKATHEAASAGLEAARRQAMLDAGDLSDPAPRVAPEIDVDVKNLPSP
jgi:hypothetical protein